MANENERGSQTPTERDVASFAVGAIRNATTEAMKYGFKTSMVKEAAEALADKFNMAVTVAVGLLDVGNATKAAVDGKGPVSEIGVQSVGIGGAILGGIAGAKVGGVAGLFTSSTIVAS